uniref:Uncharacterized protein n=1 Tax=Vespula pensylvanica TaxID=30213 RepID=A0A834P8E5_VESPE|nr:hypothetical protein H0235_005149 [Vespula pensylvanica]
MERSNIILELVAKCTVYLHLRTRSSSIVPKLTSVQRLFEIVTFVLYESFIGRREVFFSPKAADRYSAHFTRLEFEFEPVQGKCFSETWCKRWWHFSQRNISITARSFEPNLTTILMKNTQASTATKDTRENTSTTSVTEPSGIIKNQLSGILERLHIVRIKISIRLWYVPEGRL